MADGGEGAITRETGAARLRGFDRRSVVVLAVVVAVGAAVGFAFREHVSFRVEDADPLLWGCWLTMLGLAAWGASRRDLPLALVALFGGALIESWGTRSGLWTYFTGEQPPPFILPAWPMAALASERVARLLSPHTPFVGLPMGRIYAFGCVAFGVSLLGFVWPGMAHPLTWLALACVLFTMVAGRDRARDVRLFAAGCLVGYPLELWGTTHGCWVYWNAGTPPLASVLSHGFATVAFARGVALVSRSSFLRAEAPPVVDEPTGTSRELSS